MKIHPTLYASFSAWLGLDSSYLDTDEGRITAAAQIANDVCRQLSSDDVAVVIAMLEGYCEHEDREITMDLINASSVDWLADADAMGDLHAVTRAVLAGLKQAQSGRGAPAWTNKAL